MYCNLSDSHCSIWYVLLIIYNISYWLCIKHKYMMLSIMFPGPSKRGHGIDVCPSLLIEDFRLSVVRDMD